MGNRRVSAFYTLTAQETGNEACRIEICSFKSPVNDVGMPSTPSWVLLD